jgi:hypothetical protein
MTRGLATALVAELVCGCALALVALDVFAHKRVEELGGVNIWGYRGAVLKAKQPHEIRLAVVGGDFAFGWGVAASQTMIFEVRRLLLLDLDKRGGDQPAVTGVDLGARGLAPGGYAEWIDRFTYLRPDVLCLIPDPGLHVAAGGTYLPDRESLAFTTLGYAPILPLVVGEKAKLRDSTVLRAATAALAAVDRVGGHAPGGRDTTPYRNAIETAVLAGLRASTAGVAVVWPPRGAGDEADRAFVSSRFAGDARVRIVDLGGDQAMANRDLFLNDFDFSSAGHARAAADAAPSILQLIQAALDAR